MRKCGFWISLWELCLRIWQPSTLQNADMMVNIILSCLDGRFPFSLFFSFKCFGNKQKSSCLAFFQDSQNIPVAFFACSILIPWEPYCFTAKATLEPDCLNFTPILVGVRPRKSHETFRGFNFLVYESAVISSIDLAGLLSIKWINTC